MKVVGFEFRKINAERLKNTSEEAIKFGTKIDIFSIEELKSDTFRSRDELLKINFTYSITYEPEFAKLELSGHIILAVEPKLAREVLRGWKDKQTPEEFRIFMFNVIFRKSNIKALQLEEELGIPSHLPFPSIKMDSAKEDKENKEN